MINIDMQISLWYADLDSFRYMPRSGSTLSFLGIPILISIVTGLIYISANSEKRFHFSLSPPAFVGFGFLDVSHSLLR
jgi:hypothetical protein